MSQEKTLICIVCPVGCTLRVKEINGKLKVLGARCPKGIEYAKEELTAPKRLLFGAVKLENRDHPRVLPVRSTAPIPLEKILEASKELMKIKVKPPVKMGDVIVKNFLGMNVDIVATRDVL